MRRRDLRRCRFWWTWKIYPGKTRRKFWRVMAFHRVKDFDTHVRLAQCVSGEKQQRVYARVTICNEPGDCAGYVQYVRGRMSAYALAHEMFHATLRSAQLVGVNIQRSFRKSDEERMANIMGRLTEQFISGAMAMQERAHGR